jgi:hypothetical protein
LQDGGLQGSTFNYIKYIYSLSKLGAWQDETNVGTDWLQIDSRKHIAAVCIREKKISAV